jgi:hypothetical protein
VFTRIRRSTIVTALACALLALTMAGPAAARLIDEAPTSSLAGTTSKQDLRSPDAMDASRAYDIARAMERYYMTQGTTNAPGATAVDSQTRPAPVAPTSGTDGVDWPTTGIVLTVALLFAGGIVALTRRHRIPA